MTMIKKLGKKIVCVLLAAVLLMTLAPEWLIPETGAIATGDIFYFGSYPQTVVTDQDLTYYLFNSPKTWQSLNYWTNNVQRDYWQYADFYYAGQKYRAIKFSANRGNAQSNGYYQSTIYYFRFEPIAWRILDPGSGLCLAENILDYQPINNYSVSNKNQQGYAINDYAHSSLREWLDATFYDTAFTPAQKLNILRDNIGNTNDNVFLLSEAEALMSSFGFRTNNDRVSAGTDYARAQGLSKNYNSYWLRTTYAGTNNNNYYVWFDGSRSWGYSAETLGIRPACRFYNLTSNGGTTAGAVSQTAVQGQGFAVNVVNSSGAPIKGAKVELSSTITTKSASTDANGNAYFNSYTFGDHPVITVTKSGYDASTTANTNFTKSANRTAHIVLYTSQESVYKLNSAKFNNDKDVLVGTKVVNQDAGNKKFSLTVSAKAKSGVSEYKLMQGSSVIATSSSGQFSDLQPNSFKEGGDVKVKVIATGGTNVITPINLSFQKVDQESTSSLKISDKIKFTVPDSIPFIGGDTMSLDIPDLPVEVYVENGKAHVGVNLKLLSTNTDPTSDTQTFKDLNGKDVSLDKWKNDWKSFVSNLKKATKLNVGQRDALKKYIKQNKKWNLPVMGSLYVNFLGFFEGTWNESGMTSVSGDLIVTMDGKISKSWQLAAWVIPVVIDFEVGAEGKLVAKANYDFTSSTLTGDVQLTVKPHLELTGAVGLKKVIGIGVYGGGDVPFNIQLVGTTNSPGLNTVDLNLNCGLKAFIGPFEHKKPWKDKSYRLYTRSTWKNSLAATGAEEDDADFFDIENFTLQDISYMDNESAWMGGTIGNKIDIAATGAGTDGIRTLLSGTYRNSAPQAAVAGDDTVMVFLTADTERDPYNFGKLVYSVYDSESGTWSQPAQVDSDETFDSGAQLYSNGESIYVVYSNSSEIFTEENYDNEFFKKQDIVAARFDAQTKAFASPVTIAQSGEEYLSAPEFATIGGVSYVFYTANVNTDAFGANSTNTIRYAALDGETVGEAATLAENLNSITDYIPAEIGSKAGAAIITDGDNDLETTEDRKLTFTAFDGTTMQLATGSVSSLSFTQLPGHSEKTLNWYTEGNLAYTSDGTTIGELFDAESDPLTENYTIVSDGIYFVAATAVNETDSASNILFAPYKADTDTYGTAYQITSQDRYIERLSAVDAPSGERILTFQKKNVTLTEDEVIDDTDLCYLVTRDKTDLAIDNITYDASAVKVGENLTLTTLFKNNGTTPIENTAVTMTDSNGALVYEGTTELNLAPGEEAEKEITISVPAMRSLSNYRVTANVSGDEDFGNNIYNVKLGYADLATQVEMLNFGNTTKALVTVLNQGPVATPGYINIYASGFEDPFETLYFDAIEPGALTNFEFTLSQEDLGGETGSVRAVVSSGEEEIDTLNNECIVYATAYSKRVDGVTLNKSVLSMDIYGSETLEAAVTPADADHQTVAFFSSNPEVATVDAEGTVTPVSEGTTIITVETEDGGFTAQCEVTVTNHTAHIYEKWITSKEPTCSLKGLEIATCTLCGETATRELDTLPHEYVPKVTFPTCTEPGFTTFICRNCGDTYIGNHTEALGHSWGSWQIVQSPTCIRNGYRTHECTACGEVSGGLISKVAHAYDSDWTIDREASCIEEGQMSHHCFVCGEKADITPIPVTEHKTEIHNKVAASCREEGYTGDKVCTVCSQIIETGEVIPKTEHIWDSGSVTKRATRYEQGVITYTCKVCGETKTETINSLPIIIGDADGDGLVTVLDTTYIQRYIVGIPVPRFFEDAADVDGSDDVDIYDATLIQRYLVDIETAYPIGNELTD